ncbi:aa3-type cytochrome c oxidase subunit IV [Allosphingosinicella humi]
MAVEGGAKGDMGAHEQSYARFAGMMKWGSIITFIVVALVVVIIAS